MFKQRSNFTHQMITSLRSKINKKYFSQVNGNFVKFSDNICEREIKIPVYDTTCSVFYHKGETLDQIIEKIKGTHEKIESVEFLQFNSNEKSKSSTIEELIKSPFELKINGYIRVKYFPSVNILINQTNDNPHACEYLANSKSKIYNNYNFFLHQCFLLNKFNNSKDVVDNFKKQIEEKVEQLLKVYENIMNEFRTAEELVDKEIKKKSKYYLNLAILYFTLHAIVFYLLIYQLYGWDTIEPVTYIVGNVYWIAALGFFVYKKKKLDMNLFHPVSFQKSLLHTYSKKYGLDYTEKRFVEKEIRKLNQFKNILNLNKI
jgi:hypothetical protein